MYNILPVENFPAHFQLSEGVRKANTSESTQEQAQ